MAKKKKKPPPNPKLEPKLRMINNGSAVVNELRADRCPALKSVRKTKEPAAPPRPVTKSQIEEELGKKRAMKGKIGPATREIEANVFIITNEQLSDRREEVFGKQTKRQAKAVVTGERQGMFAARVPLSQFAKLAADQGIHSVEMGDTVVPPRPIVADTTRKPKRSREPAIDRRDAKVIIGIIDIGGFDFAHEEFLDRHHKTRWYSIWDQGGMTRPSPAKTKKPAMKHFSYGSELTREHMDRAIRERARHGVPAYLLEPQSQMVEAAHATHVAGIAAGRHAGVCPKALLVGVSLAISAEDVSGRKNLYDSTQIVHGIEYLLAVAEELDLPIVINVSLGTNGHAHDDSSAVCRWIDAAMTIPGRAICVAAGNAGQEAASFDGDLGYMMGRIHTSGKIPARDLYRDIDWTVVGNGKVDVSENELEIWYSAQDRIAVELRPPGGSWIGPVVPGEFIENYRLKSGSFISIYNECYHPANGANYIGIYLSPFYSKVGYIGIPSGTWNVRLHGVEIREGTYHGWIERDDPQPVGRKGEQAFWSFPSYFSETSNSDNMSVSSLACGRRVLSIANLDLAKERINITSSQGPTRDGRYKPDVAAPGTAIVAARGFSDEEWVEMTGTSMASPYVAGVVANMFAIERRLTASQIEGIIQRTSRPLAGASFAWANDAGFGQIDPARCITEAKKITHRREHGK